MSNDLVLNKLNKGLTWISVLKHSILACCILAFTAPCFQAQTSVFSYQGSVSVSGSPANGSFDMQFKLFDALSGGVQQGTTNSLNGVTVTNGSFSVVLDFQSSGFPGSNRYLEMSVQPAGGGGFTTLAPRTQILTTPYAIKSISSDTAVNATNATNATTAATATDALSLGGVLANQYVLTGDARLSNSRTPTPGSPDYIQNQNANVQANANLKIDGTATATNIQAFQYYQLNGQRIMFGGPNSMFVGPNIALNSTGTGNSFFGASAGTANTTGAANSFFGAFTGTTNTLGQSNVFVGNAAGNQNLNGSFNVYVGQFAGQTNVAGQANTFIGTNAGASSSTGSNNVAVGADSGSNGPNLGSNNTFIGKGAIPNAANLSFATAIGSGTVVGTSNTIVLGRSTDNTIVNGGLDVNGTLTLHTSFAGASTPICVVNAPGGGQIGVCSSSLRYKSNVESYLGGLNVVRRLRPIKFNWKEGGMSDVGFAAEEVNKVEPRLTIFNPNGEIQGVKYGQVTAVLVNAVKEQQAQIDTLQKLIAGQQKVIEAQQKQIDAFARRFTRQLHHLTNTVSRGRRR